MILGIVGAFIPVLPGPITGWVGLLLLHLTKVVPIDWTFLSITLVIAVLIYVLDYIIPALGAKKFGGSRYGIYGTTFGLVIGLIFFPPYGIIIGPFFGALLNKVKCFTITVFSPTLVVKSSPSIPIKSPISSSFL